MKKRGWIALLCGLLAVCPALAEQTDGVVRVGEVTYDVQTVQNALNAGYQLYESSGISLSAAQKQQLADSVLERFVGLGVLENQLRKEGQAEIDEQTRQALDGSNTVIGSFMCQGKMPMSVRQRYEAMKAQPAHIPNLDALIENFDKALSHPDAADLEQLKQAVK